MANVLSQNRRQQVVALGRLGWSLRRIEAETGIRRETASGYLRAAGVAVRTAGGSPRALRPKPATSGEVSTDSDEAKPSTSGELAADSDETRAATSAGVSTDSDRAKPATSAGVSTASAVAVATQGR